VLWVFAAAACRDKTCAVRNVLRDRVEIRCDVRTGSYPESSRPPPRSHKQKIQARVEHSYVSPDGRNPHNRQKFVPTTESAKFISTMFTIRDNTEKIVIMIVSKAVGESVKAFEARMRKKREKEAKKTKKESILVRRTAGWVIQPGKTIL
jgi:hypothetical protein